MKVPFYDGIEDALRGGVKAIQLREKDLSVRELLEMAGRLRDLTSMYNARLFINDRVDVALSVGADGVHLGGRSMPAYAARKAGGRRLLIGVSTHTLSEAFQAEREGADFITYGPLYDTPSKRIFGPPVGLGSLDDFNGKVGIPLFGLGGIKADRVKDVIGAGAWGVALVSAILSSDNIEGETKRFMRLIS
jgi:thiamine-phosphate pyrophosphorylase